LVRDVHEVEAGRRLERLHRDVLRAAVAARGVVDPAGPALRVVDELAHGLHRHVVVDHHDPGDRRDHADRLEVLHRVVADLADVRDHGEDRVVQHADGVAVGGRALHALGADRARRAGLVLDQDLLAEVLAHALRDDPDHHVDRAARLQRHHDEHGLRRVALRGARQRDRRERRGGERDHHESGGLHGHPPLERRERIAPDARAHAAARSASGASTAGSFTVKRAPEPGPALSATTVPPSISTTRFTTASPTPMPPPERERPWSPCANRSNTRSRSAGAMPTPSSATTIRAVPPSAPTRTEIALRAGVYFAALSSRFDTTCSRRRRSAFTHTGADERRTSWSRSRCRQPSTRRDTRSATSSRSRSSLALPMAMPLRSISSSTS